MEKATEIFKACGGGENATLKDSSDSSIFLNGEVKSSSREQIKFTFRSLLLQKKVKQQSLAEFCGVSKSYISPVVNGKYIPDLRMKLKIASFFGVDTSLIWQHPEIQLADKIRTQNEGDAFNSEGQE